jgi:hypothetical protein
MLTASFQYCFDFLTKHGRIEKLFSLFRQAVFLSLIAWKLHILNRQANFVILTCLRAIFSLQASNPCLFRLLRRYFSLYKQVTTDIDVCLETIFPSQASNNCLLRLPRRQFVSIGKHFALNKKYLIRIEWICGV